MNPPLEITTHEHATDAGTVIVLRVGGEVDVATAEELGSAVHSAASDGAHGCVLDLSDVTFMDSSGLRVLLVATRDHGEKLAVVAGAGGAVERLFHLAEVTDRLALYGSESDAVAALGSSGASRDD